MQTLKNEPKKVTAKFKKNEKKKYSKHLLQNSFEKKILKKVIFNIKS